MPESSFNSGDLVPYREQWLLYRDALTGRSDEWEAKIQSYWNRYLRDAQTRAQHMRSDISESLRKAFTKDEYIKPSLMKVDAFRKTADTDIWRWMDGELQHLGFRRAPGKGLDVYNEIWARSRGAKTIMEQATEAGRGTVKGGAVVVRKIPGGGRIADDMEDGAEDTTGLRDTQVDSWMDNIIRAYQQAAYIASAAIMDATSGPNALSAVSEFTRQWDLPENVLELSFTTHPRATYRATVAQAARKAGIDDYLYYLPASARHSAAPTGFGAQHHLLIRSAAAWDNTRRALGHKKPGSYIFTTGFHVGDKGVLLPVPPMLRAAAVAEERKVRQGFLDRVRKRAS